MINIRLEILARQPKKHADHWPGRLNEITRL